MPCRPTTDRSSSAACASHLFLAGDCGAGIHPMKSDHYLTAEEETVDSCIIKAKVSAKRWLAFRRSHFLAFGRPSSPLTRPLGFLFTPFLPFSIHPAFPPSPENGPFPLPLLLPLPRPEVRQLRLLRPLIGIGCGKMKRTPKHVFARLSSRNRAPSKAIPSHGRHCDIHSGALWQSAKC